MSGSGAPDLTTRAAGGLRLDIVASQWHSTIMDALVSHAIAAASEAGAEVRVVRVPGAAELPVAAQACLDSGAECVAAFGVVIKGETPHFDYVCAAAMDGLLRVSLDARRAVGLGVLTVLTEDQAVDRAGLPGSRENKGREVVQTVIATALELRRLRGEKA